MNTKLWTSKVAKVPILEILGLQFGSPRTKWHLDVGPVARHRKYYKGEGGAFPQYWAMVSFVVYVCLWLVCAQKMLQLCTNQLIFGLCKSMWMIDLLVTRPNPHPEVPACPFTLEMLQAKERWRTPDSSKGSNVSPSRKQRKKEESEHVP
jgi:hypothetical protein